jgi:TrmH family RNA methyltransferase
MLEYITSRKNQIIMHIRQLARNGAARREEKLFLCDGEKFLKEALQCGMEIETILWQEGVPGSTSLPETTAQYIIPSDLMEYISPLKNSPGPVFTVKMRPLPAPTLYHKVIILENVQDPGNVGTVIRTANALNVQTVILCGACADLYNPKTVRSTMGAIFRQQVLEMNVEQLTRFIRSNDLRLYGAALRDDARDIREISHSPWAIAIGSEGQGLSPALLNACDELLIIPMNTESESLNAAVAAALCMWEMTRSF